MENLSLSRFLILAKVIQHQGMLEGEFIRVIQQLPPDTLQSTHLSTETNSIYQTLHRLKKSNYIRIGTPRFIHPTPEGLQFYQNILAFCTPSLKIDKISISEPPHNISQPIIESSPSKSESSVIPSKSHSTTAKKKVGKKTSLPIVNPPKISSTETVKSRPSSQEIPKPISGIVSQFSRSFMSIIKDYRWKISEIKLNEIMTALYNYWNIKPNSIQQQSAYPPDTTSKMISWLGLNSALFKSDEKADIIVGLEFCWTSFQKEKGIIKN